jgi:hypothetical protein
MQNDLSMTRLPFHCVTPNVEDNRRANEACRRVRLTVGLGVTAVG